MNAEMKAPETLSEAIQYFADPDRALQFVVDLRWPNGVACPLCNSKEASFLKTRRIWKCKSCRKQFSAKLGTIFEDSPLGFDKWLPAMWMVANCRNGVSSYEIHRELGITQKSAWFMLHRIRLAMQSKSFSRIGGEIEVDETFIGGAARFMHASRRGKRIKGTGGLASGKAVVMGFLKRGKDGKSRVQATMVPNTRRHHLFAEIKKRIRSGATIYSDAHKSYLGLEPEYIHKVIDHAKCYVEGTVHTNGLENFWSLLKRGIKGTYISVEPFHLFRYIDEQSYRFNNRKASGLMRFSGVLSKIVGRRVTYRGLTAAPEAQTC